MDEIIDIYDDNMIKIGTKERKKVHFDGDWHKAFHCWIVYRDRNQKDYMVVQRRGPDKALFPNMLDISAAGHYESGETIEDGIREVKEELGIDVSYYDLIPMGIKFDIAKGENLVNREFDDVFLLVYDKDIKDYNFQVEEVSGLAVFSVDDALEMYAGKCRSIKARTVMRYKTPQGYEKREEEIEITPNDFIPRIDPYVYKMLILAKRYLNGERQHLVI
jgi:isopentenyldiphosphate isomerase